MCVALKTKVSPISTVVAVQKLCQEIYSTTDWFYSFELIKLPQNLLLIITGSN